MGILTAFGFTQFSAFLPDTAYPGSHNLTVSHLEPFGARLDMEVIKTPKPLGGNRVYLDGGETTYVHFILNQRTLPLGVSFAACGERVDGWCELGAFLQATANATELAEYDYSCNGVYPAVPYGSITNGVPQVGP